MTKRTTELIQAFLWTCDDCGKDNFARAITVAPEEIDAADISKPLSEYLEEGGEGDWLRGPDDVTCGHCGSEFRAEVV